MISMTRVGVMLAFLAGIAGCTAEMTEMKSTAPTPEAAAPAAMNPAEASLVTLEQALHFTGPGGADVVAPAGLYQVQAGEATQLKLVASAQASPIVIAAVAVTHDDS
jgi:hypothetical protein